MVAMHNSNTVLDARAVQDASITIYGNYRKRLEREP
jgi:hypothetical protein